MPVGIFSCFNLYQYICYWTKHWITLCGSTWQDLIINPGAGLMPLCLMSCAAISAPPALMLFTKHPDYTQPTWKPVARPSMSIYFNCLICTSCICFLPGRLNVSLSHSKGTECFRHQNHSVFQLIWLLSTVRWAVGCSNREKLHGALRLISPLRVTCLQCVCLEAWRYESLGIEWSLSEIGVKWGRECIREQRHSKIWS